MNMALKAFIVLSLLPVVAVPFVVRAPRFTPSGTITVDEAPFVPVACSVAAGGPASVDLVDARGAHLNLSLPGSQIKLWSEVRGASRVRFTAPGTAPVEFASCGEVTLRGGGYHGANKREVSGHAALSCVGPTPIWANVALDGCF